MEYHPLKPFLPANGRVLFLGSFPPQRKRWCMDFYYPNFINDHWRIEGAVFYGHRHFFVDEEHKCFKLADIVDFCQQQGIAFYDTSTAVRRLQDNASDKFLEVVEPTDVRALIERLPKLRAVVTTGEKATETLCRQLGITAMPKVNQFVPIPAAVNQDGQQVLLYRLPSSSRAYPLAFDKKVEAYRQMFVQTGLLGSDYPQLLRYDMGDGVVAFSTRRQGDCGAELPATPYAAFNINRYCGDGEAHIRYNREALCRLLGIDDDHLVMPHQTHGTRVVCIDEHFMEKNMQERQEALEGVDALMTHLNGLCIGVSTADCIPVLLFDKKLRVVSAIHAGWRGTLARIAAKTVAAMTAVYGSRPSDIVAQIGPGISLESFEVGSEVYEAFAAAGFDMTAISRQYPSTRQPQQQKWHIDLPACNSLQLVESGLSANHISHCGICTYQHSATYFSARRLGTQSGRVFTGILCR